MSKVPVGASIAHAYEFLFGRFFQIIGTAWVPALLYGLGYFIFLGIIQPWAPAQPPNPAALMTIAIPVLAVFVFFLVVRSVLGVSLTQEALGVRKDLTLAHFVIGPRELRLFFGYLRFLVVYCVLYIAVLAISFGAVFLAGKYGTRLPSTLAVGGKPIAVIAAMVLTCLLALWFALSMLRLVFLLPPIAAAEHRTRLSRAWSLTRGSTLRIFVVLICTFLPAAIAFGAAVYYLIGPADLAALAQAFHTLKPGSPPPLAGFLSKHAPILSLLVGVAAAVNGALLAGASAAAYRTVTGHEDPELEDDAALVAPLLTPAEVPGHHEEPADHGHEDHGHGSHDDHGHGHGGHEDHGHGKDDSGEHDDHGAADDGHGNGGHGDNGHGDHGHGGDDHGHGDQDHGSGNHDDHSHGGHEDQSHGDHGHGDHGHGGHDSHGHHAASGHGESGHGPDHGHDSHGGHDNRAAA